jgi:hypothetical protein
MSSPLSPTERIVGGPILKFQKTKHCFFLFAKCLGRSLEKLRSPQMQSITEICLHQFKFEDFFASIPITSLRQPSQLTSFQAPSPSNPNTTYSSGKTQCVLSNENQHSSHHHGQRSRLTQREETLFRNYSPHHNLCPFPAHGCDAISPNLSSSLKNLSNGVS